MCQMHVTGTAVPLPAKPASRPACLPPPPQKVPSRTRTPMGSNLTVMEKSRIRKTKGKDASKSLRDRKKSYEAGLKRRLAALNQEAKDLAEAEAALQAQRRRMLTCITALTPPSSPGDTCHHHHHQQHTQPQAPPPCTHPARNTTRPDFGALIFETAFSNTSLLLRLLLVAVAIPIWVAGTGPAATSPHQGSAAQTTSRAMPCGTAPLASPSLSTKIRAVAKPPRPKLPALAPPANNNDAAGEPDCSWLLDATDSEFAAGWQGLPWSLAALADATGGSAVDLAALDGIVPLLPVTV